MVASVVAGCCGSQNRCTLEVVALLSFSPILTAQAFEGRFSQTLWTMNLQGQRSSSSSCEFPSCVRAEVDLVDSIYQDRLRWQMAAKMYCCEAPQVGWLVGWY